MTKPIQIFAGYDHREKIGFHVFADSVIKRASVPVCITPLASHGLPEGSNSFTRSRFLIPWLCGFKGHAIFVDACDMLMLGDVAELDALFDPAYAVQVVKHPEYHSRHPRKYVGTEMECEQTNYARKNWASVMIMHCESSYWRALDLPTLAAINGLSLLQFGGLRLSNGPQGKMEVGSLPPEWNVLVDEGQDLPDAKILHWTAGSPMFPHYFSAPYAREWHAAKNELCDVFV